MVRGGKPGTLTRGSTGSRVEVAGTPSPMSLRHYYEFAADGRVRLSPFFGLSIVRK